MIRNYYNPRTPCGVRPELKEAGANFHLFQSTRPLRGATLGSCVMLPSVFHFNPRAPCGARPELATIGSVILYISIHAPLAGCDAAEAVHREK